MQMEAKLKMKDEALKKKLELTKEQARMQYKDDELQQHALVLEEEPKIMEEALKKLQVEQEERNKAKDAETKFDKAVPSHLNSRGRK